MSGSENSRNTLLGLAVLLACVAAVLLPCAVHGFPHGADADFHATAWTDVAQQWHEGTIWPRWGAKFANGFGEPIYIFYPPLSIAVGAVCTKLFGGGTAPIACCFLVLLLAGWNMRCCVREFRGEVESWIAACAYAANPYFLLCVWLRSSFAELLAAAIFPLVVKYALRLNDRRDVAKLALAYAAVWFTNFPAAVIVSYALAVLLIAQCIDDRQWSRLARGAVAMLLGGAVASWTLLPAWYEQRWVQIAAASSEYNLYWKHWLGGGGADADDLDFTHWLTVVAVALIAVALLAVVARLLRRQAITSVELSIAALTVFAAAMMFRISHFAWAYAPLLSKVQFPWRWMFVVAFAAAMLVALSLPGTRWKFAAAVLLLAGGAWIGNYVYEQADWEDVWTNRYPADQVVVVDEYLPLGADGDALSNLSGRHVGLIDANGDVRVQSWKGERIELKAIGPGKLQVGLADYPAWQVRVNGHDLQARSSFGTHSIEVSLASGESRIAITFTRTWDRALGGALSIVGFLVSGILLWVPRRQSP